jgi:hypothetical protein
MELFHEEIRRQEDLLYGEALFFECVSQLYAGQDAVIETYRKQFRNIIQIGKDAVQRAVTLLQSAKETPEKTTLFQHFAFMPCLGHPKPEELAKRARILVDAYNELFPNRPRGLAFTKPEVLQLIEAAAGALK